MIAAYLQVSSRYLQRFKISPCISTLPVNRKPSVPHSPGPRCLSLPHSPGPTWFLAAQKRPEMPPPLTAPRRTDCPTATHRPPRHRRPLLHVGSAASRIRGRACVQHLAIACNTTRQARLCGADAPGGPPLSGLAGSRGVADLRPATHGRCAAVAGCQGPDMRLSTDSCPGCALRLSGLRGSGAQGQSRLSGRMSALCQAQLRLPDTPDSISAFRAQGHVCSRRRVRRVLQIASPTSRLCNPDLSGPRLSGSHPLIAEPGLCR